MMIQAIISFVLAALSGMGVGGGGLFVIYLSLLTDTPQLAAQGLNLLFFLFSSGSSVLIHLQRRQLYPVVIGIMAAFGILGALLGSGLSGFVDQGILRKIFGTMLVFSGILACKQRASEKTIVGQAPTKPEKK